MVHRNSAGHDRGMTTNPETPNPTTGPGPLGGRTLRRRSRGQGRLIAGVAGGIGDYIGIDANLVRLLLALLTIFAGGTGLIVYLACWLLVPEANGGRSIVENMLNS